MPCYALRYVFFGTRWGSNSSFAMVNLLFTSLCPARILLPCPDSNPVNCQLGYPKLHLRAANLTPYSAIPDKPKLSKNSSQHVLSVLSTAYSAQNATTERLGLDAAMWAPTVQCFLPHQSNASQGSDTHARPDAPGMAESTEQLGRRDQKGLQFPVLVPLWQIYVRERPLPIYLHTTCMTVAALLWPLQVCTSDFATSSVLNRPAVILHQSYVSSVAMCKMTHEPSCVACISLHVYEWICLKSMTVSISMCAAS